MFRRRLAILLTIFAALACGARGDLTGAARAQDKPKPAPAGGRSFWEGEYEFGEDGGRNAGGAVIYVHHRLVIRREGDSLVAEIESNGYQTARQLVGDVKAGPGYARIYFRSYGETNSFRPYEEGQLLLTLTRRLNRARKPVVLTHWGAFQPAVNPLPGGLVYFRKRP